MSQAGNSNSGSDVRYEEMVGATTDTKPVVIDLTSSQSPKKKTSRKKVIYLTGS